MNIITVLKHPSGKIANVKVGFSLPAFLLGGLWLLYKRLWWQSAISIILISIINIAIDRTYSAGSALIPFWHFVTTWAYLGLCGIYANGWIRKALLKRGYREVNPITRDGIENLIEN